MYWKKQKFISAKDQKTVQKSLKKKKVAKPQVNTSKKETLSQRSEKKKIIKSIENTELEMPVESHYESLLTDKAETKTSDAKNYLMYATLDMVRGEKKAAFVAREETLYAEIHHPQMKS